MRHRIKGRKLNRDASSRKALAKGLIRSLIEFGKVKTTLAKAKFVRPKAERLVTKAKKDTLSSFRYIQAFLGDKDLAKRLIEEITPKFKDRPGGYLRITKLGPRKSDTTEMALLEWVGEIKPSSRAKEEIKKTKKKTKGAKKEGKTDDFDPTKAKKVDDNLKRSVTTAPDTAIPDKRPTV